MSSSLFHIARPHRHLPLAAEMALALAAKKMSRLLLPLAADMALALVLVLAVAAELVLAVKMMKMKPILISTEIEFLENTQ